jgi:hypothetical protein
MMMLTLISICLVVGGLLLMSRGGGIAAGVLSQVCVACLCPWWLLILALWLPLLAGAMAALNDAEEMPCLMNGHSVLVAELT